MECNKIFTDSPHMEIKRKFCSVLCFNHWAGHQGLRRNKNNGHWKGGLSNSDGYLIITHGKEAGKLHHRKVMEEFLGRKLRKDEIVHHINHDRKDNRIQNLKIMTREEHINEHRHDLLSGKFIYRGRK